MMSSEEEEEEEETSFDDALSLQHDLQMLLLQPLPNDPLLHTAHGTLSLPSQLLHVRSAYFHALLSPFWRAAALSKHNVSHAVLHDVLEFLVTAAVTLCSSHASVAHNLALLSAAHHMLLHELEAIVMAHIRRHLTRANFALHLNTLICNAAAIAPPPALQAALASFLSANFAQLQRALPRNTPTIACVWRLLALAHSQRAIADLRALTPYLTRIPIATLVRILQAEPSHNQQAMRSLVLSFPPSIFAAHFEHATLFSAAHLLGKYRRDALARARCVSASSASSPPPPPPPPRTRFLCESPHPHPTGARLECTIRFIQLPHCNVYARLTFDKRSALGCGASIAFYVSDPHKHTKPHNLLAGNRLPAALTLPASSFWYAFSSAPPSSGSASSAWGWRFFVQAVDADCVDTH